MSQQCQLTGRRLPAGVGVLLAAVTALTGCASNEGDVGVAPPSSDHRTYVTGSDCTNERAVVAESHGYDDQTGDVDGDGRQDGIYLVEDPDAAPSCRTFVVVDTGDVTYSANVTVDGGMRYRSGGSTLTQVVDLGGSAGDEIVVKQTVTGIEWMDFYPVYTLHGGKLQAVNGPATVYDPYGLPTGVGCTTDGRVVISTASDLDPNVARNVTRTFYELAGATWRRVDRETGKVAAGQSLAATYSEFTRPFFTGC